SNNHFYYYCICNNNNIYKNKQIGGIDIKMAEEDILREIGSISRALDSIANIEFKDLELNGGQYLYLTRVFEHPGIISDHLATLLNIDRTTTARGIRKLERAGLIFKEDDETNKKIKHLFVTNTGKKLAKEIER